MITSISNLGGFAGPYAVGLISHQTGHLGGGFGVAGLALLVSAGLLLLSRRTSPNHLAQSRDHF
jgi:hypothetical protein